MTGKVPKGYFFVLEAALRDPDFVKTYVAQLRDGIDLAGGAAMQFAEDPVGTVDQVKKKARRKKSAYSRALSQELKKANKQARTKAGRLRKGMTPDKILKKAHKAAKRRFK